MEFLFGVCVGLVLGVTLAVFVPDTWEKWRRKAAEKLERTKQ